MAPMGQRTAEACPSQATTKSRTPSTPWARQHSLDLTSNCLDTSRLIHARYRRPPRHDGRQTRRKRRPRAMRSEEHTSELQSHLNLVCRLLLEKKKNSIK